MVIIIYCKCLDQSKQAQQLLHKRPQDDESARKKHKSHPEIRMALR